MNTQMRAMLDGIKLDTSLYSPDVSWDGCGWLDRDGTLIPVPGFAKHHLLARYINEVVDTNNELGYVDEVDLMRAGLLHVSEYLGSYSEPTEKQKDVLFKLACHYPRIMEGINVGVRYLFNEVRWTL